jgi:crossover junction endodeoxyribonuclease RuvC
MGMDLSLDDSGISLLETSRKSERGFKAQWWSVTAPSIDTDKRLLELTEAIRAEYYHHKFDVVAIEGLSYGSNLPSSQERAALHFMVRASLIADGREFITVPPTTLKKFVCDTGKAKKELILKEVFRRWGVDTDNDNQADAAALAIFAAVHAGPVPGLALTKVQQATIESYKANILKKRDEAIRALEKRMKGKKK